MGTQLTGSRAASHAVPPCPMGDRSISCSLVLTEAHTDNGNGEPTSRRSRHVTAGAALAARRARGPQRLSGPACSSSSPVPGLRRVGSAGQITEPDESGLSSRIAWGRLMGFRERVRWSGFRWFGPSTRREVGTRRITRAVRAERPGHVWYSTPDGAVADAPAPARGPQRTAARHGTGWSSRSGCHRRARMGP